MSPDRPSSTPPTRFGAFYPRGYVVVAFKDAEKAEAARRVLIEGGYDPQDVFLSDASEVLKHTTAHLGDASAAAKVGAEYAAEQSHQELAQQGYTFMLAYAPSDLDTERLMTVVRRFPHAIAHKYDRFTLVELGP